MKQTLEVSKRNDMTKDTKTPTVYTRLSNDDMLDAEGQREAILEYVVATASQTHQDRHRERVKRGIRAARERRMDAAAAQAEYPETFLQSPQP
jgi:hypothetical protein